MAILVTGAGGLVGRAAVAALLEQGVEQVRAIVRSEAQVGPLRQLGAKVAVLDARDRDGLEAVLGGVFTACSLTGGLWGRQAGDPAAVLEPADALLAAAAAAGVHRLVVLSPAAAGRGGAGGHLAAKAEVERRVRASGLEHAILRCTHVLGPGGGLAARLRAGDPVVLPGDGRQRVAPAWVGDVARAIALADDAVELRATWSLAGPTEVTLDGLVDALRPAPPAKRHTRAAAADGLSPAQAEVLAADSLADPDLPPPPGLRPLPLAETLARLGRPGRR
jgi:NAD(P)H dehydrogenase (quinone)